MGVITVSPIATLERVRARHSGKNRGYTVHVLPKAHMIIPFVIDRERLDPRADRVVGEQLEICRPMRIDGPIGFEISTNPF